MGRVFKIREGRKIVVKLFDFTMALIDRNVVHKTTFPSSIKIESLGFLSYLAVKPHASAFS